MKRIETLITLTVILVGFSFWGCSQAGRQTAAKPKVSPETKKVTKASAQPIPKTKKKAPTKARKKTKTARRKDAGQLSADRINYDFGKIEPKAKLTGKYTLTNTGKETLKIDKIGKSCGCTQPRIKKKTLEPGETTELSFGFNASAKAGKTTKKIWLTTKPPAMPEKLTLTFSANIKKLISVTPEKLTFKLDPEAKNPNLIKVSSTDGKPIKISRFNSRNNTFNFTFDPKNQATEHEIPFTVDSQKLLKTPNGVLTIYTDHPKVKAVSVPYNTVLPFAAHPPTKAFLKMKPGDRSKAKIKIVSNFGREFELGELSSAKDLIDIMEIVKVDDGYQIEVALTIPADSTQKYVSDHLVVNIKDHPEGTLKIHCYGRIKQPPKKHTARKAKVRPAIKNKPKRKKPQLKSEN